MNAATRSRTTNRLTPPPLLPSPLKTLAPIVALFVLAGCQPGPNPRPVPSVSQIGSELKCLNGDHGYSDLQAGWGFCYPSSWQYRIRAQSYQSPDPRELDVTFDITDRSEEHTSELQSPDHLVCRLLLEKKKKQ